MSCGKAALLAALTAWSCLAQGASDSAACWRELEFGASNSWASATTTLRFETLNLDTAVAQLVSPPQGRPMSLSHAPIELVRAKFEAMFSHGELLTWYDTGRRSVLQVQRTAHGRESRYKLHVVLADGVWRERRVPEDEDDDSPPRSWEIRSQLLIPYPQGVRPGSEPVLTALMLIAEASRLASSTSRNEANFAVLSDTSFYRVRLRALDEETASADWRLESDGPERHISGERRVRRVVLEPQPLNADADEDPLTLLELSGDLSIVIDIETAIPVSVEGTWLRIGTVPASLHRARLAPGCEG